MAPSCLEAAGAGSMINGNVGTGIAILALWLISIPLMFFVVGFVTVARGDIDMENVEAGVYLWGTLLSGPPDALAAMGATPGYPSVHHLVTARLRQRRSRLRRLLAMADSAASSRRDPGHVV